MTEDKMVGWHHQLDGNEFEQIPGDSEGQGSLMCCSLWGRKESVTTEQLNNSKSYPALCNPMNCSTPGFPVHHQVPELAQTHAY